MAENRKSTTKKNKVTKKVNSKKNSTSPKYASTKKKVSKNTIKKINNKKKVSKNKKSNKNIRKNNNIKRNTHSIENNIRLNNIDDIEYVPFLDENSEDENIIPNRIRKVEPDNTSEIKRRKIRPFTVIKIIFFIGAISAIIYLMFTQEIFNLENIEVKGNEKYSSEEIISKSGLKLSENVFKQLLLNGKDEINLAYIADVKFGYSFPNSIIITVSERYPAYIALDKNTQNYYKLDNEGYILEKCDLSQKNDELLVEGFVFEENVEFGEKINEVYIKKLDIYNNIKKLLEEYEIDGKITKVNFSNSLTIISLDDKLNIVFSNDSNLEYKVSFLKEIIKENDGELQGTIDMSVENPVYSKYD